MYISYNPFDSSYVAKLGLEESPIGRPKGWHYYLSTPATQPADRLLSPHYLLTEQIDCKTIQEKRISCGFKGGANSRLRVWPCSMIIPACFQVYLVICQEIKIKLLTLTCGDLICVHLLFFKSRITVIQITQLLPHPSQTKTKAWQAVLSVLIHKP